MRPARQLLKLTPLLWVIAFSSLFAVSHSHQVWADYAGSPCATPPNPGTVQGNLVPSFTHANDTSYVVNDPGYKASDLCVVYTGTGGTLNSLVILQNPDGCPNNPTAVAGDNRVWINWDTPCVDVGESVEIKFKCSGSCSVAPDQVVWTIGGRPTGFKMRSNVGGLGVTFVANSNVPSARADVAKARDAFDDNVTNSATMATNAATPGDKTVHVLRDVKQVLGNDMKIGLAVLGGTKVWIDMGDIDAVEDFMEGDATAKAILASLFLNDDFAHEFGHIAGMVDPDWPDKAVKGVTVNSENTILQELGIGVERKNYGYIDTDGKCKVDFEVDIGGGVKKTVKLNVEDLKGAGEYACGYPDTLTVTTGVGGITELPELAGASAQQASPPAPSSRWPAGTCATLATASAAAVLATAGGAWYARRRRRKA